MPNPHDTLGATESFSVSVAFAMRRPWHQLLLLLLGFAAGVAAARWL